MLVRPSILNTFDMNEFANMTPDEVRVLREHRANKAMAERPVPKSAVFIRQIAIIRQAAQTMLDVNPHDTSDKLAAKILELVPEVVAP
jgi:hypothetical protein